MLEYLKIVKDGKIPTLRVDMQIEGQFHTWEIENTNVENVVVVKPKEWRTGKIYYMQI